MREIKTKDEFRKIFHYDHKGEMYVFVITESIIITKGIMDALPLETLVNVYNEELGIIKRRLIEKAEDSSLN